VDVHTAAGLDLSWVEAEPIDGRFKALPFDAGPLTLGELGTQGWNLLEGHLPSPTMVLRRSHLEHNLQLMAAYCRDHGVELAPHAKTTMAPQLVDAQLRHGAWGITAATAHQAERFRCWGVPRVVLANVLVQPAALRWAAAALADPGFELLVLVDSVEAAQRMRAALRQAKAPRPLDVLLELGHAGGRSGCRTIDAAEAVAEEVGRHPDALRLVGVEAFEGLLTPEDGPDPFAGVRALLRGLRALVQDLDARGAFSRTDEIVVTAGGSSYFDHVVEHLGALALSRPVRTVLRSGCYVSHDSGPYRRLSPLDGRAADGATRLKPALEVWGTVLSRPEAGLAIIDFGKRDVPHDLGLPAIEVVADGGGLRQVAERGFAVAGLNDQHAIVAVPTDDPLAVGELVCAGISHPCTAFDKWGLILEVDDHHDVVGGVRTFFE
jgi:D-serine dehydratase